MKSVLSCLILIIATVSCFAAQTVMKSLAKFEANGNNLLRNGGLTDINGSRFRGWDAYYDGYAVEQGAGRDGSDALVCESDDTSRKLGALQTVVLNQSQAYPIGVSCWSKCEGVEGAPGGDYSIYLDLQCADGTPIWGQLRAFPTGTNGWNNQKFVIYTTKPIKSIAVFCLFRNRKGKVWFDDVRVEQLKSTTGVSMLQGQPVQVMPRKKSTSPVVVSAKNGLSLGLDGAAISSVNSMGRQLGCDSPSGFMVRDMKQGSDYYGFSKAAVKDGTLKASCAELGVNLQAQFKPEADCIRVTGRITDTTRKERALNMMFALPVDAPGWSWGDDVRRSRVIQKRDKQNAGMEYINSVGIPCGATTTASLYPVAAISGKRDGLCIGIDMGKIAVYRLFYNSSTRQLAISYDFGLVPDSVKHPGSAEFSFVIYRYDPAWGFRQAWADYARMYPDYFKVRSPKHGIWMPFGDISRIQGWQDFGFKYHEGIENVPFDVANGLLAFRYSEPTTWWMSMPKGGPRTEEAVLAERDKLAATNVMANAVINSGMVDVQGKPCYLVQDAPWCDGAVWNMSVNPYLPKQPNGASVIWNDEVRASDYGSSTKPVRAGEYLDSLEGYITADLNYRKEHYKYSSVPLSFDANNNIVMFKGPAIYEFLKWMSEDIHSMGKLMFANGVPYRFTYLCPWLDVMGTETNWLPGDVFTPDSDETMIMRRSMAYGKPYLLLMNTRFDAFGVDMVERYFKRSAFYGILPGMFSHNAANEAYFDTPKWYNRDRALFKRYIPLITRLSESGWQPVSYARSSNKSVYVERYGKNFITLLNDSEKMQTATIRLDTVILGLKPDLVATERFTGKTIAVSGSAFTVTLAAGDVMMIDLAP
ncbi:MAG: hypothetical protein ACYC1M_00445 [Armatimonadota bacterium]